MNELKQIASERELRQRIKWLIDLRWFAAIGVFIVITVTTYILRVKLPLFPLYLGNVALVFYNILFFFYKQRLESQKDRNEWFKKANRFANLQISLDLIMLTYLIHFSGGAENPFIFYFIFHMVIASILLSNRAAYLQATLAIVLFGGVILGECLRILPHYHLGGFIHEELCLHPRYLLGVFSVFVSTLYLTIYMATCIVNRLRKGERELAVVNEKLAEQDRLKSQYVQTVSHELQASLSTIQSCLKVVLSDLTGSISEKSREMVARAEQRSRQVLHFVKDLLDLSKIRATKELEKKLISFSEIVKKVIEQLKGRAEEKGLTLSLENSTTSSLISANPDALEQLLVNLIVNAIKYTPWGGNVGIQTIEQPDCFQTVVSDTGIGIPQEDLSHIFEDFYRAKNAEQMEKDGTGLGLSIVKQIIEAHKGEIWVESQVGKGSRFIFTLPKGGTR
ncbi:MAG: sensor histidine kinase [bacterium]